MDRRLFKVIAVFGVIVFSGCGTIQKVKDHDELETMVSQCQRQLKEAQEQHGETISELQRAKNNLEEKLKSQIGDQTARLEMSDRGLVITFLAEIFFDSGKAIIQEKGMKTLQDVAEVLNEDVVDLNIVIEGHTDNIPIKYSGWKSNWELSTARALAVLHYFISMCDVKPQRLAIAGYSQYRPMESNETPKGRQRNRRVEIVVLPVQEKVPAP